MKPISEEQLQSRLPSGSKSRLRNFRSALKADRDSRNYDSNVDAEFSKYCRNVSQYLEVKAYLKNLRSIKDGKLFSQGVKSYEQMAEALDRFTYSNWPSFQWNRNYQSAVSSLKKRFSMMRLHCLQYHDDESMISALPKTDTHSGFSFLLTGMKEKKCYLSNIFQTYAYEEQMARENHSFNKPILPGCRTQGSGAFSDDGEFTFDCKHKTRLISMIDIYQIFGELKFAKPIQEELGRMSAYAGGKTPREISRIISNMRNKYGYFISLDYSSYDQSISDWLIYDAFDIIACAFVDLDAELYDIVVHDFIEKNFISADGVIYSRKGVPSGSMFTQIIDSIVNWVMITTYFNSVGTSGDMIVMGDDNLFYTRDIIKVESISSYIKKNFGVVVNSEKSSSGLSGVDPEFLSRVWRANGQYREENVVISKMLYPERFRNYKSGEVSAALVLYAYILTYPLTMQRLMDIDMFLIDHPNLKQRYIFERVDSRYLPGALAFIRDYTMTAGR